MGRESTIDKIAPAVRAHITKRLRQNCLTLDALMAGLR
jgi:hypothetical protein